MRILFKTVFKSSLGFSMVQAILGLGVITGLGLVVAQISKQSSQVQKTTVSNYSIIEISGQIQSLLSQSQACFLSLQPLSPLNIGSMKPFEAILQGNGTPAFVVGQSYSNDEIRIERMTLQRRVENSLLVVTFKRRAAEEKKTSSSTDIRKEFLINTQWAPDGTLVGCSSAISNYIETVVELAVAKACMSGGVLLGPDDPNAPTKCKALAQVGDDPAFLKCDPGQTYNGLVWDSSLGRYRMECKSLLQIDNCKPEELMRRESDGTIKCINVSCGGNSIALGLDSTGMMRCKACGVGETLVYTASGPVCKTISCENGKYLQGINDQGNPICLDLVESNKCPSASRLIVESGKVKLDCCTPSCSNNENICEGVTSPSANGCGVCIGTKAPDCTNANQICIGSTGPSANGCGSCEGAKPPQNATWTWSDTAEIREITACIGGKIKTEKKQVKVCHNDQLCGGSGCTGPTEQWVPGPDKSCSSTVKKCTYTQYDQDYYPQDQSISEACSSVPSYSLPSWFNEFRGGNCSTPADCTEERKTLEGMRWFCSKASSINTFTEMISCQDLGSNWEKDYNRAKCSPINGSGTSSCSGGCMHYLSRTFVGCEE